MKFVDSGITIPLQAMIDHTATRILQRPDTCLDKENSEIEFLVKVGGDAQSHLGTPNQIALDESGSQINRSISYNEALVPLIMKNKVTGRLIFKNVRPAGRFRKCYFF